MARRRESIIDVLLVLPWWVSVIAAAVVYSVCTFVLPGYFASSPYLADLGAAAQTFALYLAAFLLLVGAFSFLRAYFIRRKFDTLDGLEGIRNLSWRQFESIVGEAFRRRGFSVMENAVDGPDGGVDLVLRKDGAKFYVQCKHWKQRRVGVKPIRELYGVIAAGDAKGGFFVTSGVYSKDARAFAKQTGIELIDGEQLASMIAETREQQPFMDPTIGRRKQPSVPTDDSWEPPEIVYPEASFQAERRARDSRLRRPRSAR